MGTRKERIILLCTGLYFALAYFVSLNFLYRPQHANGYGRVLGSTSSVTLPENSNLPSLITLFELSNAIRLNNNLSPLQLDSTLTKLAQSRADDMASRGYFAHQSPEGLYYYDQLNEDTYSCENLALNSNLEPQIYVDLWITSTSGHKECLLNASTTRVGYGVAKLSFDHLKSFDSESYIVVAIQASN
jgi:uncharacterized protein YkwD